MRVIGGIMTVRMTGSPLVIVAVVVAMAVLGDRRFELGVPFRLGSREGNRIVRRRVRGMRQQRAERHRKSEDDAQHRPDDPIRYD